MLYFLTISTDLIKVGEFFKNKKFFNIVIYVCTQSMSVQFQLSLSVR